jgi:2-isopropylmalate synthase
MPYLPIDPKDLGRSYDAVIRVNRQSGKGGISYLLENEYGLELPRRLQIEFSQVVQAVTDDTGKELTASELWNIFQREYSVAGAWDAQVVHAAISPLADGQVKLSTHVYVDGRGLKVDGQGSGPIVAFVEGVNRQLATQLRVLDYHEHAIGSGADAKAVAYLELRVGESLTLFGVGIDTNIVSASLKAITSGMHRARRQGQLQFLERAVA